MKNLHAFLVSFILTILTYAIAYFNKWVDLSSLNYIELFAVFTSYASTYLCVVQSRHNYIWGAISVVLYSWLFYNIGLISSTILNLYLFPVLLWGWFRWRSDSYTRPVTFVEMKWWPMYITFTVAVWFILNYITNSMNATLPVTDSAILILSILAQSLLDQKKIETWAIWFAVNVFAIYTYYNSELYMVALQYVVFLMNTLYGTYAWIKTMGDKEIETV